MNIYLLNLLSGACDNVNILRIILFIKNIINYAFILIPMGLIVMLSLDMAKNVVSDDESIQKKNFMMFIKRCIYVICLFSVPSFVNLVISLVDDNDLYDLDNYKKCINVTSLRIDNLVMANKSNCLDDYEWDSLNSICIYVGEKSKMPDKFGIVFKREKRDVNSRYFGGVSGSSRSTTMMEYTQGNSSWGSHSFCSGNSTMSSAGCGATAIANIATGYSNTNRNVTPDDVRKYICDHNLKTGHSGLGHSVPVNKGLMQEFGLNGEMTSLKNASRNYSESVASELKSWIDSGYGTIILVPGHYTAVDKGGCPSDKVFYYDGADLEDNGCMTMRQLWDLTWNRAGRCDKGVSCGWRVIYRYKRGV